MLVNADCTVYEKDTYARHVIKDIYWNDSRGRTVTKGGIQINDQVIVYIYSGEYVPKSGDIIIKDECSFQFDATSQQTASQSMKLFRELHPEFAVVKNVQDARYGGLPHIEVLAR
jgi:exosome complex RNA-binding protein Rrp4